MQYEFLRSVCILALAVTLGACSSSGGGDDTGDGSGGTGGSGGGTTDPIDTPDASDGYADGVNDSIERDGVTWTDTSVVVLTRDGGEITARTEDIGLRFTAGNAILEYEPFDLDTVGVVAAQIPDAFGSLVDVGGERHSITVRLHQEDDEGVVGTARMFYTANDGSDFREEIIFVYGYDTDPATIDTLDPVGGSVSYSGDMNVIGYQGNSRAGTTGTVELTADFTSNMIDGSFSIDSLNGIMAAADFDLVETAIVENGYSGEITVDGALNGTRTLNSGEYTGQFYGDAAQAVGGTVFLVIDETGEDSIYLQGAFVGSEN